MLICFYWLAIFGMVGLLRIAAWWNPVAREWIQGRRHWRREAQECPAPSGQRVWFHAASLGEFEQARTVIEGLAKARADLDIVLTFFSPSGYRQRKDYPYARVMYLPADLPGHAAAWLDAIQPDVAVFVKYDLWPGFVRALADRGIPAVLMSAHWSPKDRLTSWANPLVRPYLRQFARIFLQRDDHLGWFGRLGFPVDVAGDTRIDRCLQLPGECHQRLPDILRQMERFVLVAGSTWGPDEEILFKVTRDFPGHFMIVPHDVHPSNVERILRRAPGEACTLSAYIPGRDFKYLVIDRVGLLGCLYALGDLAYVGGGFGRGLHNTLEPMAHGVPVIFGPSFHRFPEAADVLALGGGYQVSAAADLQTVLENLSAPEARAAAGTVCRNYLLHHQGATQKILDYLVNFLTHSSS